MSLERPGPYVPLSKTFATSKTGAAIRARFGFAGLGVWTAMLAAADRGLIVLRHQEDWMTIAGPGEPPDFSLDEFLTFLGHLKQTRKTRQGHVVYVEITHWEDWNNTRKREVARRRKSRNRRESERDIQRDNGVTPAGHEAGQERDLDLEVDTDSKPSAVSVGPTEPEWAAEDERPWHLDLREMPA